MPKNTSVILGEHFEGFIAAKIEEGRFLNSSEAVREGLRLLEEREVTLDALRQALIEGEESGESNRSFQDIVAEAKAEMNGR